MDTSGRSAPMNPRPGAVATRALTTELVASTVIVALAVAEGVDLGWLRLPFRNRPELDRRSPGPDQPRLLDWHGGASPRFDGPQAARRFFEAFELHPGLVVRGWEDPDGRLGFGLEGDRVVFELHLPAAGLLIRGDPDRITVALRDTIPETVCCGLAGEPLERLVAWPPALGPGHRILSVEVEDGVQMATVPTRPEPVAVG